MSLISPRLTPNPIYARNYPRNSSRNHNTQLKPFSYTRYLTLAKETIELIEGNQSLLNDQNLIDEYSDNFKIIKSLLKKSQFLKENNGKIIDLSNNESSQSTAKLINTIKDRLNFFLEIDFKKITNDDFLKKLILFNVVQLFQLLKDTQKCKEYIKLLDTLFITKNTDTSLTELHGKYIVFRNKAISELNINPSRSNLSFLRCCVIS